MTEQQRADEERPVSAGGMTLEERAHYIAGAMHANSIGGHVYNRIRERALKELTAHDSSR